MCGLRAAFTEAVCLGLLSLGSTVVQGIKDKVHQGHTEAAATAAAGNLSAELHAALHQPNDNPFLVPPLSDFMDRFNIPKVHGSGIYVDLGGDKEVDGRTYREPSGLCPVFGKTIVLYQPQNNPNYKNDFLDDMPTKQQSDAVGHPLPGGFNNSFKMPDKSPYSPMSAQKLNSYKQLKANTPMGKCAEMSFMTTAGKNSSYRYPWVYDTKRDLCYFLYLPVQRLMGERYCSVDGKPDGMTWYCFEPHKALDSRPELVYGSAYVGRDPDYWETHCPNKAVKDAVFGVWVSGRCTEHKHLDGAKKEKVNSKAECWSLAFENPEVASDHPVTEDENFGTYGYFFPSTEPNQPKSGGEGVNFASFYPGSMECWLSGEIPTCLVPLEGAAAFTALGSLEEETAPCTDSFPQTKTPCDRNTCTQIVATCVSGTLVSEEVPCSPEDGTRCEGGFPKGVMIGLAAAGGILLLLLGGGGFLLYRSRMRPAAKGDEATRSDYVQEEAAANRRKQRQSDLVQQAEPSFWEEAEADEAETGESTHVLVDQDY
uniref:Apical membrane antigen 1 n=2 Tax=Eimeria maxima TaxID=5804 RepID=A0A2C8D011_EIMMA|nr:Apical membrane antigen 1 [Eimeria maxima]